MSVSVIIPVYNAEHRLRACLSSVLDQTHPPEEVICVDDGSSDGSAQVLRRFTEADPRLRVITQENRGASAARNAAFDVASGEFITYVDTDDEAAPHLLETLLDRITHTRADVALGNKTVQALDGSLSPAPPEFPDAVVEGADYRRFRLLNRSAVHGKLFRRAFLEAHAIRWYEGITYEDYLQWIECVAHNPRIALCSASVYTYKRDEASITAGAGRSLYHVRSRALQALQSVEAARGSSIRGYADYVFKLQYGQRLLRSVRPLRSEPDEEFARQAFSTLREYAEPLRTPLLRKLRGYRRLLYALILDGSLSDLQKLLRFGEGEEPLGLRLVQRHSRPMICVAPQELPSLPRETDLRLLEVTDIVRSRTEP